MLLHSLPGLEPQLTCVDYDACELLTASDHRPVAADLVLSVPAAAGAAACADAARSPRRHSLVVRGGGSLRCQLRLSELTLHDDDAAERLALFPMSSVADGAAVEPSLGERASSVPLVPPGSLAEAANEIGPPPRGLRRSTHAPSSPFRCRRGSVGVDEPRRRPWDRAAGAPGGAVGGRARRWRHRRRRPRDCARPRRPRIVKLVDAERAPLGQGVLSVALPWSAAAPAAAADARPFSIDLSLSGAYVGQLRGVVSTRWGAPRAADASRGWLRGVAQLLGAGDDDAGEVALGELVVDDGGDGGGVGREVSRESDPLSPRGRGSVPLGVRGGACDAQALSQTV